MVVLFVVLTIILFVTITYFVQRKEKAALEKRISPQRTPLLNLFNSIPSGVFLQPSFTWGKLMDTGNMMLGIHPVILGLIGQPDKIETLEQGKQVKKGDPILKLHAHNKQLNIKSPVDGVLVSVNPDFANDSMEANWLYGIKPENISDEIPNWFVAEKSTEWLKQKYEQIKNFLMNSMPQDQMGLTMADGGELPWEVMAELDQKIWTDFETQILQ